MEVSNSHNLVTPPPEQDLRYGIRVTLARSDPFRRLVPEKWEMVHWYPDAETRDQALQDMSSRHRYSRMGDAPATCYEAIER
jgi:hypothetical protein